VSEPRTPDQDQWKPEELQLRKREIKQTGIGLAIQFFVALFALAATAAAAYAALKAGEAVEIAAKGIEQQADAERLSTAISAIGGDRPAQRGAGFTLLRRHVQDRVDTSDTPEEHLDAYNLYTSALDVLELYLRNQPEASTEGTQKPVVVGFGRPRVPYDNKYAAKELQSLMNLKPEILELQASFEVKPPAPTLDLSNVQLTGQSWPKIDFAWLGARFFPGIDLRGANLTDSIWGKSFLEGAHLQCAELKGANLREARLVNADLRGANLEGADFTNAELTGINLRGATGWEKAKGLPEDLRPAPDISRVDAGIDKCLNHKPYNEPATPGG
jgi:hypothetical protein